MAFLLCFIPGTLQFGRHELYMDTLLVPNVSECKKLGTIICQKNCDPDINNNNNNISLLQTDNPYTYKKMLNIYKNSNKNNNNNKVSQSKIVLINITLISTIAEWESEYKQ